MQFFMDTMVDEYYIGPYSYAEGFSVSIYYSVDQHSEAVATNLPLSTDLGTASTTVHFLFCSCRFPLTPKTTAVVKS